MGRRRREKKAAKKAEQQAKREQAKADANTAESYWGEYSKWKGDETSRYQKDMASYSSKYANNPDMLKVFADKRTSDYEAEMSGLQSGERGRFLNDYYNKQGGANSGMSMEDWYSSKYGNPSSGGSDSPAGEQPNAPQNAKQKIAGMLRPGNDDGSSGGFFGASKTGTGWW